MNLFGITDIGSVRKDNQDSYAIRVLDDQLAVAVVCDGMGGAQAGNVASAVAVEAFAAAVEDLCGQSVPEDSASRFAVMREACQRANAQVHELSRSSEEYRGMGTTLVAVLIVEQEAYVLNVGDSRCYLLENDTIEQITLDHSLVQVLVDRGEITPDEARTHPKKNLITRALGVDRDVEADFFHVNLSERCRLLLCTDGLTNVLTDDVLLREAGGDASPEDCCKRLMALTLEQGAPDNVTIVLAQL